MDGVGMNMLNWLDCRLRRHQWWREFRGLPEPVMSPAMRMIFQEALRVAHEKPLFMTAFDAPEKTIRVRRPNQYTGIAEKRPDRWTKTP
jgi:hypothetical protein